MRVFFRVVIILTAAISLTACPGGADVGLGDNMVGELTNSDCFEADGKEQVLTIMQQWYLWNDEPEQFDRYSNINLAFYDDVDHMLEFLRYRPETFDRGFTHTSVPAEEDAFFGEGQYVGFGFSLMQTSLTTLRISQVFAGSPAGTAGVARGYTLTHIDGRSISEIVTSEGVDGIDTALGPATVGDTRQLTFENTAGEPRPTVELTKEIITIDPLPVVDIIDNGGTPVGYLFFRTFISPADPALRNAFATLSNQNVRHLIVDLRYNGGGLVSTARTAASLMAGPANSGNIFSYQRFNSDRSAEYDSVMTFASEANATDLDTIVFITTGGTASASELVINGLEPYFTMTDEVAIVGQRSFGKPVGQSGFNFCNDEWRLRVVTFQSENVAGFGDYFNGLPVDCSASDDLERQLGDPNEAMLATALGYTSSGTCTTATMRAPAAAGEPGFQPVPVSGYQSWKQNAYAY